jgi:hypothetical protein
MFSKHLTGYGFSHMVNFKRVGAEVFGKQNTAEVESPIETLFLRVISGSGEGTPTKPPLADSPRCKERFHVFIFAQTCP